MKRLFIGVAITLTIILISLVSVSCGSGPLSFTLTVQTNGQGTVTCTPASETYEEGSVVTLSAAASSGWQFKNWSGDATGSSESITVTMTSSKVITANFARLYTLTINVAGQGSVSPAAGSHTYLEGEVVTITATAGQNYGFEKWSGDATGSSESITVTMTSSKVITANFVSLLKSDHLVLTIDTSTYGYSHGDQVDVLFKEGDKFHLSDCFGEFDGSFSISGDKLKLDFDNYPAYTITFVDDTHFTGAETSWHDTGTYQWVEGQ